MPAVQIHSPQMCFGPRGSGGTWLEPLLAPIEWHAAVAIAVPERPKGGSRMRHAEREIDGGLCGLLGGQMRAACVCYHLDRLSASKTSAAVSGCAVRCRDPHAHGAACVGPGTGKP